MSPMQKMLFGGEEPIERLMSYDKLSVLTVAKELSPNQVIRRPNSKQQAHIGLCPFHKENTPSFWVRPSLTSFKTSISFSVSIIINISYIGYITI